MIRRISFLENSTVIFFILLGCLILSACSGSISPDGEDIDKLPNATAGPWEPATGDEERARGEVYLDKIEIVEVESDIPEFILRISGALPTPCHEIRVAISEPDDSSQIQVEVHSLTDPGEVCIQVLEPFEINIPLSDYIKGVSRVIVNGQIINDNNP